MSQSKQKAVSFADSAAAEADKQKQQLIASQEGEAKRKKKRRAKKKAGAAGGEEEEEHVPSGTKLVISETARLATENQLVDPVTATIDEVCVRTGISRAAVTAVVNEMWENGERYDVVEDVVEKLLATGSHPAAPAPAPAPAQQNGEHKARGSKANKKEKQQQQQQQQKATEQRPAEQAPAQPAPTPAAAAQPAPERVAPQPAATATAAPAPAPGAPAGLAARLETAAAHSNVAESLAALTAWKNQANAEQLAQFFESKALEYLVRSVLLQPQVVQANDAIPSQLQVFLTSLVPTPTSSSVGELTTRAILDVAAHLSALQNLGAVVTTEIADGLAHRLTAGFRRYRSMASGTGTARNSLRALDDRLHRAETAAKQALPSHEQNPGLRSLLIARDALLEGFNLSVQSYQLVNSDLSSYLSLMSSKAFSTVDDEAILHKAVRALGGASGKALQSKQREALAAKAKMEEWRRACDAKTSTMQFEVQNCNQKLATLQATRDDLIRRLAEANNQIEDVTARRKQLEASIEETNREYDQQLLKSDRETMGLLTELRRAELNEHLVHAVNGYDRALQASLQLDGQDHGQWLQHAQAQKQVQLLTFIERYAETEARTIQFLKRRIAFAQEKVIANERELQDMRALHMESMAAELHSSIKRLKDTVAEDMNAVTVLTSSLRDAIDKVAATLQSAPVIEPESAESLRRMCAHARVCAVDVPHVLAPYASDSVAALSPKSLSPARPQSSPRHAAVQSAAHPSPIAPAAPQQTVASPAARLQPASIPSFMTGLQFGAPGQVQPQPVQQPQHPQRVAQQAHPRPVAQAPQPRQEAQPREEKKVTSAPKPGWNVKPQAVKKMSLREIQLEEERQALERQRKAAAAEAKRKQQVEAAAAAEAAAKSAAPEPVVETEKHEETAAPASVQEEETTAAAAAAAAEEEEEEETAVEQPAEEQEQAEEAEDEKAEEVAAEEEEDEEEADAEAEVEEEEEEAAEQDDDEDEEEQEEADDEKEEAEQVETAEAEEEDEEAEEEEAEEEAEEEEEEEAEEEEEEGNDEEEEDEEENDEEEEDEEENDEEEEDEEENDEEEEGEAQSDGESEMLDGNATPSAAASGVEVAEADTQAVKDINVDEEVDEGADELEA